MMDIEIRLFSRIQIAGKKGLGDPAKVATFNQELASLGYTLSKDLLDELATLAADDFGSVRHDLHQALTELSGADANHIRLFNQFPYQVPEQREYLIDRVIGFLKNQFGIKQSDAALLSCGHFVDRTQFDLAEFGACPICQFSVEELNSPSGDRIGYRHMTAFKVIGLLDRSDAATRANAFLSRLSSLSVDEKTFLRGMIEQGADLQVPAELFRETLPFVFLLGGTPAVKPHMKSATDVLRIAAFLSDTKSDLSLKMPCKFRLTTSQKKSLLALLDAQGNLEEDMLRNRERWLRFGEVVRPGAKDYRARFPNVARAFDVVRNRPDEIVTYNRVSERIIRSGDASTKDLSFLAGRPGAFARQLDVLLRKSRDPEQIIAQTRSVAPQLTTKMLFELDKYLQTRDQMEHRLFLPKGNENRVQVAPDNRAAIQPAVLQSAQRLLHDTLIARLQKLPPMGKCFIDPILKEHLVPFNRRGDSSTLTGIAKGSRYLFEGDVVRLFVHWVGHIDVDLSIVLYDDDLMEKGHVAFTNLQYPGCVHSGDIQDAPNGASEFIDVDIASLTSQGIRYVAGTVHSYRGQRFKAFPCFAGFMQRDSLKSGAVYEPGSVGQKFDLNSDNTSHMPLVFDLVARKVIFADIAAGNRRHGHVAGEHDKQQLLLQSVLTLNDRKPTLYEIMMAHVEARGELAALERAEHVFGFGQTREIVQDFVEIA